MHTYLGKLTLLNFKNYEDVSVEFCPKINCLTGNNGIGKTNILDAIYYLSVCKSFFTTVDSQNIKHGEGFFVIQGEYNCNEIPENIYCGVKSGQKKMFRRNSKEYERLSEHIGLMPVVMISPSDTSLIIDGSDERRKFIDGVLSQFDHMYLDELLRYNKALTQRNLLLKEFAQKNSFDPDVLEIWDMQLISAGIPIFEKRKLFIKEIIPVFQEYYQFVSGGNETVELDYESQLTDANFEELLKNSIDKDRKVQFTTVGPHKDDLILKLGEYPIKRIGSQGQQKTYLVSLKLAQFDYIKLKSGKFPMLLLDDIFDKFDSHRVNKIINLVASTNFGQIFITDTSRERMEAILEQMKGMFKLFQISGSGIEVISNTAK